MNSGFSPARIGAATLIPGEQVVDASQKDAQRKSREKVTATSLLQHFLYWIYERRLLHQ
jgi:hypothetical protein